MKYYTAKTLHCSGPLLGLNDGEYLLNVVIDFRSVKG